MRLSERLIERGLEFRSCQEAAGGRAPKPGLQPAAASATADKDSFLTEPLPPPPPPLITPVFKAIFII